MVTFLNNGYQNNPNLPKASYKHAYTQAEWDEFKKCRSDKIYFTRNYVKIVTLDKGMQPFALWDFQENMMNVLDKNRFTITKYPRQTGKTSVVVAYLLHEALFHKNWKIAILSKDGAAAQEVMERLQFAFEFLPMFLKQGIVTWNKRSIIFANGSKIVAKATGASGVRGDSYNIIFLDEFAHIQKGIAEKFFTSTYPTISSGKTTKVIIVSTPLGMNMFYEMWEKAIRGKSLYIPIEVHWSQVPGRDQAWKEETIANTSEEQFRQEFETEFIGSSDTLISGAKLRLLMARSMNPVYTENDNFFVFERPIQHGNYCVTVDTSRGQGNDFQVASVLDVSSIPYKQVAVFRDKNMSPLIFPTIIYNIARTYNDAAILVEINDIGSQIADILHYDLNYENLIKVQMKGKLGQQVTPGYTKKVQLGVKTSVQTKKIGCANLKTLIENDKLLVFDEKTISEFFSFVSIKNTYAAEEGMHDDLVMSLVLFSWLVAQKYFKESGTNIRQSLQEDLLSVTDEDIVPFGIIDDGLNPNRGQIIDGDLWFEDRKTLYPFDDFNWGPRL